MTTKTSSKIEIADHSWTVGGSLIKKTTGRQGPARFHLSGSKKFCNSPQFPRTQMCSFIERGTACHKQSHKGFGSSK
jgi:hypothetical protein